MISTLHDYGPDGEYPYCARCGCGESATTHCRGLRHSPQELEKIQAGSLNFVNGQFVRKQTVER